MKENARALEGIECPSLSSLHCERTMKVISALRQCWLSLPCQWTWGSEPRSHQRAKQEQRTTYVMSCIASEATVPSMGSLAILLAVRLHVTMETGAV